MTVLDQPGRSVGRHGAQVLASLAARSYPAGLLAADRAFSSARAEEFQLPALALGYRPVYDYKIDQLGVQDEVDGFLQIEGDVVLPVHPRAAPRGHPGLSQPCHRRRHLPPASR